MKFRLIIGTLFILLAGCNRQLQPFTSDGCSAFPDGTMADNELWLACCEKHDLAYWQGGSYTAAICAAPKVLAHAGLLDGKSATGYPGVLDSMELPATQISGDAVVIDGKVVTSRGPGTAMEFALTLIAQLLGEEKRNEVEQALVR